MPSATLDRDPHRPKAPVRTPPPTDRPAPDRLLGPLRRRFAAATFGLLSSIALNVLGETEIGAAAFLASLLLAVFTAHQIGRSGVERPLASPAPPPDAAPKRVP